MSKQPLRGKVCTDKIRVQCLKDMRELLKLEKLPHEKMWEELPFIIGQITDEEIYNIPLFSGHGTLDLKNLIIDKIKLLEAKHK